MIHIPLIKETIFLQFLFFLFCFWQWFNTFLVFCFIEDIAIVAIPFVIFPIWKTDPAKFEATTSRLPTSHMVTSLVFLNWILTLWTILSVIVNPDHIKTVIFLFCSPFLCFCTWTRRMSTMWASYTENTITTRAFLFSDT